MLLAVSETTVALAVLAVAGLIAIGVVLTPIAERYRIPPTVALVVIGFLVSEIDQLSPVATFELGGDQFNFIVQFFLLPTLVFAAAREMSTRHFLTDFAPILALAIPAFLVSMTVVALILQLLPSLMLPTALVFGALITATDPVAVVDTFKRVGVPQRLETLVQGESVMNDGIAIVMYNIFVAAAVAGTTIDPIDAGIEFVVVFFGGVATGVALGILAAIGLQRLGLLPSVALTIAVAYASFALAELLGLSGVIATLTSALVLGAATPTIATRKKRQLLDGIWSSADFIANAILFLLLGFEVDAGLIADQWPAILAAIAVVYLSRVVGVVTVINATCKLLRLAPISARYQAVMIWGGLRGGVALALALSVSTDLPGRNTLIAMTFGVVLATLLFNATTIPALIRRLRLDEPTRIERVLGEITSMICVREARARMRELELRDVVVESHLATLERQAARTLRDMRLTDLEWVRAIQASGIGHARYVAQNLVDEGLIWGPPARSLLGHYEAEEEALRTDAANLRGSYLLRGLLGLQIFLARFQRGERQDPVLMRFAHEHAREVANDGALEHLAMLHDAPALSDGVVVDAASRFVLMRNLARQNLLTLRQEYPEATDAALHFQAWNLTRVTSTSTADELRDIGVVANRSAQLAIDEIVTAYDSGVEIDVEQSSIIPQMPDSHDD